jgi:DNA anti-recombination protein RmuC
MEMDYIKQQLSERNKKAQERSKKAQERSKKAQERSKKAQKEIQDAYNKLKTSHLEPVDKIETFSDFKHETNQFTSVE